MKYIMEEMTKQIKQIPERNHPIINFIVCYIPCLIPETYHIDQMIRELHSSDKNLTLFYRTKKA
ncbi:hypothetical protein [Halobacillus karajensis]|uniref:hypothetical protein n=1 Tax=Halobacillus karajensis TaxID=195088 RepID=UPI0012DCCDED|nr:hypothetical protein [Halobacillus karajensis]